MRREDGNVLLLVLMVGVILMALLAAEVTITRVNLRSVDASTVNAQLDVQAVLSTPNVIRSVVARLPAELNWRAVNAANTQAVSSVQQKLEQDWGTCATSVNFKVIFDNTACGLRAGTGEAEASERPVGLATEIRLPVLVQYTYTSTLGRRTRQARGEVVYRSNSSPLPVGAFAVLADELGAPLPSTAIFDGPVHVNGLLKFAVGRSEYLAGVSSATAQVQLGDATVRAAQFAPSPALPCDQLSLSCPKFDAGVSVTAPRVAVPTLTATPDVVLSPLVTELVLAPSGNGGTEVYACTASSCERYWYSSFKTDGVMYRHVLPSPVPPTDGQPFSPPEPQDPTQAWQPLNREPTRVMLAPGEVQVRSLVPNGAAYQEALTLAATGNLTVTSSLNPVHPACSTFAVRGDDGALIPAACTGAGRDALGLVSLSGDLDLGNTASALPGSTLSMQASVLAPMGAVRLADPAVRRLDWIGSAAAHIFTPDARMRLAFNVVSNPPGFPTLAPSVNAYGLSLTPPTLRLAPDGPLGLGEGQ